LFTETAWTPVSKPALFGGALAGIVFCIYALIDADGFLFLDYVNLPFHEFGHLFFRVFGEMTGIWGGTLMQLTIPFGIFTYFLFRMETSGVFFSSFWFGENLLNIAVYIGDARTMALPLVGGGEHDWNIILSHLNMLGSDHYIAGTVKALGWLVMLASITWFLVMGMKPARDE
jgi:hypothetical protein